MGMKREAVQEERQRTKERDQSEVESTSSLHADMPIERILEAEKRVECKIEHQGNYEVNIFAPVMEDIACVARGRFISSWQGEGGGGIKRKLRYVSNNGLFKDVCGSRLDTS